MDSNYKQYKVVIIDDEKHGRDLLRKLIPNHYCPIKNF